MGKRRKVQCYTEKRSWFKQTRCKNQFLTKRKSLSKYFQEIKLEWLLNRLKTIKIHRCFADTYTNKLKPNKGRKLEAWEKFWYRLFVFHRKEERESPLYLQHPLVPSIFATFHSFNLLWRLYIFFFIHSFLFRWRWWYQDEMNILFEMYRMWIFF